MRERKPCVLVWHDHWPTYSESLDAHGLSHAIDFRGAAGTAPDDDALERAQCMLASTVNVPAGALSRLPNLQWIQTVTVGVDEWLSRADLSDKVSIVCARGVHRVQMPENILGAIFYAAKPFARAKELQGQKIWDNLLTSTPIAGQTLGIVGLGAIGAEVARKAKSLEMNVVGVNRLGTPAPNVDKVYPIVEIDKVLAQSDYVLLLIPATAETENLMNRERFAAMKQGAWLLNFARGHVIVDADLIAALRRKHLAGAVLDAFRDEPLSPNHPFWEDPDILMLPHLGGKHPTRNKIVAEIFSANVARFLKGEPLSGIVDRRKGY